MFQVRIMVLIVMLVGGIFSLLATSEPPVYPSAYMELLSDKDAYGLQIAEVCPEESLILRWVVSEGNRSILNAIPSVNISPTFVDKSVNKEGEVEIITKGDVEITLVYDQRNSSISEAKASIKMIPQAICTGYPMDIRGNFRGQLLQVEPENATLNRDLTIYWSDGKLLATMVDLVSSGTIQFVCTADDLTDSLQCIERTESKVTFKLGGKFTATDFSGTYEGIQQGSSFETSVSGTFSFKKSEDE